MYHGPLVLCFDLFASTDGLSVTRIPIFFQKTITVAKGQYTNLLKRSLSLSLFYSSPPMMAKPMLRLSFKF